MPVIFCFLLFYLWHNMNLTWCWGCEELIDVRSIYYCDFHAPNAYRRISSSQRAADPSPNSLSLRNDSDIGWFFVSCRSTCGVWTCMNFWNLTWLTRICAFFVSSFYFKLVLNLLNAVNQCIIHPPGFDPSHDSDKSPPTETRNSEESSYLKCCELNDQVLINFRLFTTRFRCNLDST